MESSWESVGVSFSPRIANLLWSPMVPYRLHKAKLLFPKMSQENPVPTLTSYLRSVLISSSHIPLTPPIWSEQEKQREMFGGKNLRRDELAAGGLLQSRGGNVQQ
jgi:hypothetical protein